MHIGRIGDICWIHSFDVPMFPLDRSESNCSIALRLHREWARNCLKTLMMQRIIQSCISLAVELKLAEGTLETAWAIIWKMIIRHSIF